MIFSACNTGQLDTEIDDNIAPKAKKIAIYARHEQTLVSFYYAFSEVI